MKRIFLFLVLLICTINNAGAQLLVSEECHVKEGDLTAYRLNVQQPIVIDGDTIPFAVVRVGLTEPNVSFDSRWVLKTEVKDNEYWVYFMEGVKSMTVKSRRFTPMHYSFPEPLVARQLYVMSIHKNMSAKTTGTLNIFGNVPNAEVYIDGEKVSDGIPFRYVGENGPHQVELRADGFDSQKREVIIPMANETNVTINLFSAGALDINGISYGMVPVKATEFIMGSDINYYSKPAHSVRLMPFSIGSTFVSVELWKQVMGYADERIIGLSGQVVNVSYDECIDFIKELNKKTGKKFRLPTEAEWEYCAKNKSVGVSDICTMMEWCSDWLGKYKEKAEVSPKGPHEGIMRVVRGGSELSGNDPVYSDPTFRWRMLPEKTSPVVSFRLACDD